MAKKRKRAKTQAVAAAPRASTPPAGVPHRAQARRRLLVLAALVLAAGVLATITTKRWRDRRGAAERAASSAPPPAFVGAGACGGCHERELNLWKGSHHALAMQPANGSTVLGDFNDASIADGAVTSRMFRRGGKFMVRTGGPDGALHDYEIKFTFGVSPLQQYLIEMPGGRLQALGIAWDSRPRERGGQRWFNLFPGLRPGAGDPLHWTGIDQNWNFMCADCHSTNLRRNYHPGTRTFTTSYAEIDVACEACHGPGARHVAWAGRGAAGRGYAAGTEADDGLAVAFDERRGVIWKSDPSSGNVTRSAPRRTEREIQTCARCHSRRSQIHEDYVHGQPVDDDYRVALLEENLYYPDGQIKDEDYEYGSFIQSRMYHAGVTCSDCHEPHSLKLRASGNGVCLQCHSAARYDSAAHHFHQTGSPGAQCVECHMPARIYMTVDARRDHSIRIPRPDLSVKLGVPNACTACHRDKSADWAAGAMARWYGHQVAGFQRFAEALHAGAIGAPEAPGALAQLAADSQQPAIARASALALMAGYAESDRAGPMRAGAGDASPLVRRAAARLLPEADPQADPEVSARLLGDPVRAVRIEAGQALAGAPASGALPAGESAALQSAVGEYIAAQELSADRPEALSNLALLFAREKRFDEAQRELAAALALDPSFAPAAVDLADLDRELGRDADGEHVLRGAIARSPADAPLQHALGLLLVRQGRGQEALEHLAAAARLDPASARFAYVYAVALNGAGQGGEAIDVLEGDVMRHPYDCDALGALAAFYRSAGNSKMADGYAKRLAVLGSACQGAAQ